MFLLVVVSYSFCFSIQQHKDKNICRLSIELLDTEDTHSEDPVEVEVRPVTSVSIQLQDRDTVLM